MAFSSAISIEKYATSRLFEFTCVLVPFAARSLQSKASVLEDSPQPNFLFSGKGRAQASSAAERVSIRPQSFVCAGQLELGLVDQPVMDGVKRQLEAVRDAQRVHSGWYGGLFPLVSAGGAFFHLII